MLRRARTPFAKTDHEKQVVVYAKKTSVWPLDTPFEAFYCIVFALPCNVANDRAIDFPYNEKLFEHTHLYPGAVNFPSDTKSPVWLITPYGVNRLFFLLLVLGAILFREELNQLAVFPVGFLKLSAQRFELVRVATVPAAIAGVAGGVHFLGQLPQPVLGAVHVCVLSSAGVPFYRGRLSGLSVNCLPGYRRLVSSGFGCFVIA